MYELHNLVDNALKQYEAFQNIDDTLLNELVNQLIKHELQPGGPYLANTIRTDILLNARIEKLFLLLGTPLPNITHFIQESILTLNPIPQELFEVLVEIEDIRNNNQIKRAENKKEEAILQYTSQKGVEAFLRTMSPETNLIATPTFSKILTVDRNGEISQLAVRFAESLEPVIVVPPNHLSVLGQANLLVWLAYTLYDDIIDNDSSPQTVSTANILMRKSFELYRSLPYDFKIVLYYYDAVDKANAWETHHCRFVYSSNTITINEIPTEKEMENLLENRALAHCLGPTLIARHYVSSTTNNQKIEKALRYYCVARQLNDDLHDWIEDFENGRMSYVVAHLLRSTKAELGIHQTEQALLKLKKIFYEKELEILCNNVETYINKALRLLASAGLTDTEKSFAECYLKPIGSSVEKAKAKHISNKTTLLAYKIFNE